MRPVQGRLVFASASPQRLELLRQIGIQPDEAVPANIDESVFSGELPRAAARRLAAAKRDYVAAQNEDSYVLAVHTLVACGRRVLRKAEDEETARHHLAMLSGRRHRVWTGLALRAPNGASCERQIGTVVAVKRLTAAEQEWYCASGEWRGKDGAYGIQGRFAAFVKSINGSHSNAAGLPLSQTAALLSGLGYPVISSF